MAIQAMTTRQRSASNSQTQADSATSGSLMGDKLVLPPIGLVGKSERSRLHRRDYLNMLEEFYGKRSYNVGRFQKVHGLNVNGELNDETKGAIERTYAAALSNPEKAVNEGRIIVSATSADEFKAVVRGKLAKALGVEVETLAGNRAFEAAKQFQRANGLVGDGIIGEKTLAKLDRAIEARYSGTDGIGYGHDRLRTAEPTKNIPVGAQAVKDAQGLLDIQKRTEFILQNEIPGHPLEKDINGVPRQTMVSVLQGLLKTIGYKGNMTPGIFDSNMSSYIADFQKTAIRDGSLPPFQVVQNEYLRTDPVGPDPGCVPGDVGKETFRLLKARAEEILRSKS